MLEINKPADIVVPFTKIGSPGWEVTTRKIIEAVAANWGDDLPEPIGAAAIAALENRLGTSLPTGLTLFYQTFGLADIGEQLQALAEVQWLHTLWEAAPQYGPTFTADEQQVLPYLVSFSDGLGSGNQFCFHSETQEIYLFAHDRKPHLRKLLDSVDEYLKGCLLFAQADLSTQPEAEAWTNVLAAQVLSSEAVQQWPR